MGQYFRVVFLTKEGEIRCWMCPAHYGNGGKLMEHAYLGNNLVKTVEHLLSPEGEFHMSRIVWAGDYAEPEPTHKYGTALQADEDPNYDSDCEKVNLYYLISDSPIFYRSQYKNHHHHDSDWYRYIVNHSKKMYVDKWNTDKRNAHSENTLEYEPHPLPHPLPLLVAEGNGVGGGDYYGIDSHLCGTWARDVISVESEIPDGYEKLECVFHEDS